MVPGAETPGMVDLPDNAYRELYEFPARAIDPNAAERAERLRIQAVEADHDRVEAASNIRVVEPGRRFTPYEVAHPDQKFEEHVVLKATHWIVDRSYETAGDEPEYRNEFEAMPSRIPATPHRERPRPQVAGAQVGIIAGPEGEEIHCDKYGRIKLWFPWDRRAKKDGSDTCWVRVSQNWAGGGWGGQIIPRIGMEAMVAFIDGDPDRPLVTSLVPNPQQKVPYDLPANKTRSIIRSNSHKSTGFNEMTFEDATGAENMFFHAQKDQTTRVLNNRTKRVDAHEVASIGGNRAVEVGENQKTEVGGSMNVTVGGTGPQAFALMAQVAGLAGHTAGLLSQAGQIAGGGGAALGGFAGTLAGSALGFLGLGGLSARNGVVSGPNPRADAGTDLAGSGSGMGQDASGLFPFGGIMNTVVGSFQSTTVGVAQVEQVGMSKVTNVGATQMTHVGKEQRTTVGKTIRMDVGDLFDLYAKQKFVGRSKSWTIAATEKILLTTPGGYIELNKKGIKLHGLRIDIEGNRINFSRGGPGRADAKDFAEECPEEKK